MTTTGLIAQPTTNRPTAMTTVIARSQSMATTELDIDSADLFVLYDKLAEAGIPKSMMFVKEWDGEAFSLELYDGKDSIEFVPRREAESAFVRDQIEED